MTTIRSKKTNMYTKELVDKFEIRKALQKDDPANCVLVELYESARGRIRCAEFSGSAETICASPGSLGKASHAGPYQYFQTYCKGCQKIYGWGRQVEEGKSLAMLVWDSCSEERQC